MISMGKKARFFLVGITLAVLLGFLYFLLASPSSQKVEPKKKPQTVSRKTMSQQWATLSGNKKGKVVFAQPPHMYILELHTGKLFQVPNVVTAGAKGRRQRGKAPRPSWAPDGKQFVYRFENKVYVCDEKGNKKAIENSRMDCGYETRWSWRREKDRSDWIVGPSTDRNVIQVNIAQPSKVKTLYNGGDVVLHCEVTGSEHIVYDNDSNIMVTPAYTGISGLKISKGQSCRPCASPDNRVAWLPNPHTRYDIHDAETGKFIQALHAPEGEEIYRLNWSNLPDFAVHMFGSRGDNRMNVRKVSTGEHIFIGYGWDPDLWIEE